MLRKQELWEWNSKKATLKKKQINWKFLEDDMVAEQSEMDHNAAPRRSRVLSSVLGSGLCLCRDVSFSCSCFLHVLQFCPHTQTYFNALWLHGRLECASIIHSVCWNLMIFIDITLNLQWDTVYLIETVFGGQWSLRDNPPSQDWQKPSEALRLFKYNVL